MIIAVFPDPMRRYGECAASILTARESDAIGHFWAEIASLVQLWTKAGSGSNLWEERFTDVTSLTQFNRMVSYKWLTAYY
jgi:hypothetical protein